MYICSSKMISFLLHTGSTVLGFNLSDGRESFWGFVVNRVSDELFPALWWPVFFPVTPNDAPVDLDDAIESRKACHIYMFLISLCRLKMFTPEACFTCNGSELLLLRLLISLRIKKYILKRTPLWAKLEIK